MKNQTLSDEERRNYWVWEERDEWMRRNGEIVEDDDALFDDED